MSDEIVPKPVAAPVVPPNPADPSPPVVPSDTEAVAICRCLAWHEQTQPTNRPYLAALAQRARKCLGEPK